MNDKEIIKALECCQHKTYSHCKECVFFGLPSCNSHLATKALDLINRQQAEIENYIKVAENQQNLTLKKSFEIKELKAENERLKQNLEEAHIDIREHLSEIERLNDHIRDITKMVKAESIEDFVKLLKEKAYEGYTGRVEPGFVFISLSDIQELSKKFIEGDK